MEIILVIILALVAIGLISTFVRDDQPKTEGAQEDPSTLVVVYEKRGIFGFMGAEEIGVRKTVERYYKPIVSGRFWYRIPGLQKIVVTSSQQVTPQTVPVQFSAIDRLQVSIGFVLRFQVVEPIQALIRVEDVRASMVKEAGLIITRTCSVEDFLREDFNQAVLSDQLLPAFRDLAYQEFGVLLQTFGIDEIIYPEEIKGGIAQRALARVDAEREQIRFDKYTEIHRGVVEHLRDVHAGVDEEVIARLADNYHRNNAAEDSGGAVLGLS